MMTMAEADRALVVQAVVERRLKQREALGKWMAEDGLWRPKRRREARVHQSRPRRARVGELVQVDGSPHDWFEGRGPRCSLIVFIDDATSRLLALRFFRSETTQACMETLRNHLAEHGRPVALYSDRHSVFRVNRKDGEDAPTQFTRALKTLDIEPVHASTPQAKGRNLTLQDRLVKEMRLRGIDGIPVGADCRRVVSEQLCQVIAVEHPQVSPGKAVQDPPPVWICPVSVDNSRLGRGLAS